MVNSNPGGLLSKCKWRNVPFLPLYDCCFSFSYFPCLFWNSPFFVIVQKPFGFDRGKEKNKYLKSFLPGTCVLQTGWLDDGVIMCLHWLISQNKVLFYGLTSLFCHDVGQTDQNFWHLNGFSRTQELTFQLNTYFILSKNKISCKNIHDIPCSLSFEFILYLQ